MPLSSSAPGPRISRGRSYLAQAGALRLRDYRLLWLSSLGSALGMSIEQVAMGWLVLEMTDSPFLVGVASAARMAPFFFVGIPAGAVADRVDRRVFLRFLTFGIGLLALLVAVLIVVGVLHVWHLLVIAALSGVLRSFYMTTRQSFVYDIVGPGQALNGLALNTIAMRIGGVGGSLMAGGIIAVMGVGEAYMAMAASYFAGGFVLFLIREPGQSAPARQEALWQNFRGAIKLLRENRVLAALVGMAAAAEMLGFSHQTILPVLARDVLHVGAGGLGVMMAVRHSGGIISMVILGAWGDYQGKGKIMLASLFFFGVSIIGLAYSSHFLVALIFLAMINGMAAVSGVLQQTLAQVYVPNEQRGRATGAWIMGIGTAPIGHLEVGAVAGLMGAPLALLVNGAALAAVGLLSGVFLKRIRRI